MNRYTTNGEEGEILPNLLRNHGRRDSSQRRIRRILDGRNLVHGKANPKTKFSVKYICDIHRTALKELYSLPGVSGSVNISKGGFVFPAGRFIPDSMRIFEEEILSQLPDHYTSRQGSDKRHRQGTRRITLHPPLPGRQWQNIRILANLMARNKVTPV